MESIEIEGHASFQDGVARVEIWVNEELHLLEEDPPTAGGLARFAQSWMPPGPGEYIIEVIAIGSDGSSSAPDVVRIRVGDEEVAQVTPSPTLVPEEPSPTLVPTETPPPALSRNSISSSRAWGGGVRQSTTLLRYASAEKHSLVVRTAALDMGY